MKEEEFQGFTSFDFITLVFSLAVIVAISTPIIKKNFQSDSNLDVARHDLSRISQIILSPQALKAIAMNSNNKGNRAVASVDEGSTLPQIDMNSLQAHLKSGEWEGEISKDPWGNPYHFAFLRNKAGMPTHVAVWSDGPNQKSETTMHEQLINPDQPGSSLPFNGDDVGTIIPIR